MKKITLLVAVLMMTASAYSQNVVSLRGNLTNVFSDPSFTYFGPGLSFQHGLTDNIALGFNFDYEFGENSSSLMNIEPRLDYYFNEVFNGFHAGTNFGFNISSVGDFSANSLNLGANLGYTHPLTENILIDISTAPAIMMSLEEGGNSEFGLNTALSFGYSF